MLNMNKQYRDELRTLKKNEKKILTDLNGVRREARRQINLAERSVAVAIKACEKGLVKINRRRSILEGRLSS